MRWREKKTQSNSKKNKNLTLQVASLELENQALKQRIMDLEALQSQTEKHRNYCTTRAKILLFLQGNKIQNKMILFFPKESTFTQQDTSQHNK